MSYHSTAHIMAGEQQMTPENKLLHTDVGVITVTTNIMPTSLVSGQSIYLYKLGRLVSSQRIYLCELDKLVSKFHIYLCELGQFCPD